MAVRSYRRASGLFAQRVAGGDTELGGPGGRDAGVSSSQGRWVILKLDSGPACVLLSGGGGQQVDWGRPLAHDNESILHRGCFPPISLLSRPPGEKLCCVSMWSVGRLRAGRLAAAVAVSDSVSHLAELFLQPPALLGGGIASSMFYLSWPSCFHPSISVSLMLLSSSRFFSIWAHLKCSGIWWIRAVFIPVFWNRCGHLLNLLLSPSWKLWPSALCWVLMGSAVLT